MSEIVFAVLMILAAVMLVGHLMWVAAAWILRKLFRSGPAMPPPAWTPPPAFPAKAPKPPIGSRLALLAEVESTRRTLQRLRERGAIDAAALEALLDHLRVERARVLAGLVTERHAGEVRAAPVGVAPPIPPREVPPPLMAPPPLPTPPPPFVEEVILPERPPPVSPPRRPFGEVLAAFFQAKNIRWGELVAGMLIVFCSAALVISLWDAIGSRPIGRFATFIGINTAFFGVGFFMARRWKLPTTSRSILAISALLVPLNFLAIAALSRQGGGDVWWAIPAEIVAAGVFAFLLEKAARILAPPWAPALAAAVLVPSAAQLVMGRIVEGDSSLAMLLALGGAPLFAQIGGAAWAVRAAARWRGFGRAKINSVFFLLGLGGFAAILSTGFLVYRSGRGAGALRDLAVIVSGHGIAALAGGLLIWKRPRHPGLGAQRFAGAVIAVVGALILLWGVALGWPRPASMASAALLAAVVLAAVGFRHQVPAAHLLAALSLVAGFLPAFHAAAGGIGWLEENARVVLGEMASSLSGAALIGLAAVLGGTAAVLGKRGLGPHGRFYALGAAGAAFLGIAFATAFGFGRADDPYAVWIYAISAPAAVAFAWVRSRRWLCWLGSALVFLALAQALAFRWKEALDLAQPWQAAFLAHASLAVLAGFLAPSIARGIAMDEERARDILASPLVRSSLVTSVLAVWMIGAGASIETAGLLSAWTLWLGLVWIFGATAAGRPILVAFGQAALACSLASAVVARLSTETWFAGAASPLLDPRTLAWTGTALALFILACSAVRVVAGRIVAGRCVGPGSRWRGLCIENEHSRGFDGRLVGVLAAGAVVLTAWGAWPGILQEFATSGRDFERAVGQADYRHAYGPGAWALLGALAAAFLVRLRERFSAGGVLGLETVGLAACFAFAGPFENARAGASALRWSLAGYFLLLSAALWARQRLVRPAERFLGPAVTSSEKDLALQVRVLALAGTVLPILYLSVNPLPALLSGSPIGRPDAASWFGRIGPLVSCGVPLAAVCVSLAGHAARERSAPFAFAAACVLNLTVSLGYVLSLASASGTGARLGSVEAIQILHWNAIASATAAAAWLLARPRQPSVPPPLLLRLQLAIAPSICALVVSAGAIWLFLRPGRVGDEIAALGSLDGWLAAAAAAGSWVLFRFRRGPLLDPALAAFIALATAGLAAYSLAARDGGTWLVYHVLLSGITGAAWAVFATGFFVGRRLEGPHEAQSLVRWGRWTSVIGILVAVWALRGCFGDPIRPCWWSAASLAALSGLSAAMALRLGAGRFVYAAGLLANGAATAWWATRPLFENWNREEDFLALLQVNGIALALPAAAAVLAVRLLGRGRSFEEVFRCRYHRFAAILAVAIQAFVVWRGLGLAAGGLDAHLGPSLSWSGWLAALALAVACLWDARGAFAPACIFFVGLAGAGLVMDGFGLRGPWLACWGAVALAVFGLLAAALLRLRPRWLGAIRRMGVADGPGSPIAGLAALAPLSLAAAVVGAALALEFVLWTEPAVLGVDSSRALLLRLGTGLAALFAGAVPALLAGSAGAGSSADRPEADRSDKDRALRIFALSLGAAGAVIWAWAWIEPRGEIDTALHRAVLLMTACSAVAALYGFLPGKLPGAGAAWALPLRQTLPWLLGAAGAALIFTLGAEVLMQVKEGRVPLAFAGVIVVASTILGLAAAGIVFAVAPGRDPLGLSEKGRTGYVYAAEVLLGLLFLHIRLTMPWLFSGFLSRYWPLIVMGLAFLSVGLGEFFRRRSRMVLASPLERTGVLLPVFPVLGYWLAESRGVEAMAGPVDFSLQLLLAGGLYGMLAVTRRSFGLGILGALAVNGGLWHILNRSQGLAFIQHPQLWLIPAALSVLAAAYLSRKTLAAAQLTAIRSGCILTIYVSSTADVFIAGVGRAPWMPLVLAGLSILGVLVGMASRILSFLLLGVGFLLLSLLAMVWHATASLGWTWLWWIVGLGAGVVLLTVFALFEKQRERMLGIIEGMKRWER